MYDVIHSDKPAEKRLLLLRRPKQPYRGEDQDGHVPGPLNRPQWDGRVGDQLSLPGILLLIRLWSLIVYRPLNRIATAIGIAKPTGREKSALVTMLTLGFAVITVL